MIRSSRSRVNRLSRVMRVGSQLADAERGPGAEWGVVTNPSLTSWRSTNSNARFRRSRGGARSGQAHWSSTATVRPSFDDTYEQTPLFNLRFLIYPSWGVGDEMRKWVGRAVTAGIASSGWLAAVRGVPARGGLIAAAALVIVVATGWRAIAAAERIWGRTLDHAERTGAHVSIGREGLEFRRIATMLEHDQEDDQLTLFERKRLA